MSNRRKVRQGKPLPAKMTKERGGQQRLVRRFERRVASLGHVMVKPAGWGAKHNRRQAVVDAETAARVAADEAAAAAAARAAKKKPTRARKAPTKAASAVPELHSQTTPAAKPRVRTGRRS